MDLQKVFEGIVNTKNVELGNVLSYPTINDIYIEVFTKKFPNLDLNINSYMFALKQKILNRMKIIMNGIGE